MNNTALQIPRPIQSSSANLDKRFRWWHEAIIDDMIAFPLDTLKDRGQRLGYSVAYLSSLVNSDMFQLFYQQRKAVHVELLHNSLVEKTGAVAGKTLDIMLETLEKKRDAIPFAVLADTATKTLGMLGYGAKPAPAAVVEVNNNTMNVAPGVTPEQLADARGALRRVEQQRAAQTIEHQASPPGTAKGNE